MNNFYYITVLSIFFPVYIQFQGRDATTTGSLAIVCFLVAYLLYILYLRKIQLKFSLFIFSLLCIGIISTSFLPPESTMQSIRHLGAFTSSMILFFVTVNYFLLFEGSDFRNKIDKLISFIVLMGAVQICIGMILYFYPPIGKFLAVFAPRNIEILVTVDAGGKRLQSVMTGWEGMGEFIAVLAPLVFYHVAKRGSVKLSVFYVSIYVVGLILANTRSAFLLFALSVLIYAIWNRRTVKFYKVILYGYVIGSIFSIAVLLIPSALKYWEIAMARFAVFDEVYSKTGSLIKAIDRDGAWNFGLKQVGDTLSLFGNGMQTPGNFHCLYLTVIYTLGVIGAFILFSFFVYLLLRLFVSHAKTEDSELKCLVSSCIISYVTFLINEVKFEFTRDFSYQQFIWLLFALYWLVSSLVITQVCAKKLNFTSR